MKIYALANELNLDRSNTGTITVPFGTWDYGEKTCKMVTVLAL